jgi:hypothetical protein
MFLLNKKKREIEKLKYKIFSINTFSSNYKIHLIDVLEWLVGYYENKTASTPKEYLESMINNIPLKSRKTKESEYIDFLKNRNEQIVLLYNWVYYKEIVGF